MLQFPGSSSVCWIATKSARMSSGRAWVSSSPETVDLVHLAYGLDARVVDDAASVA
jgi:hypothetical protein